jgi:hypothetical protein
MTFLLAMLGCAGGARAQKADSPAFAEDRVSLTVVPRKELRRKYGSTMFENPFLAPKPLITRRAFEFIVLRLTAVGKTELVLLQAEAVDQAGRVWASFYPRDEFADLSLSFTEQAEDNTDKKNQIGWYYLPSERMQVPSGSHSYLLALVGEYPFPETVTVRVRLRVGGEEKSFEFQVNVAEGA